MTMDWLAPPLVVEHNFGNARFGLSYTCFSTDLEIDQVALPPSNSVILDGEYDQSHIHFVGMTVAVPFGFED
jgi:hypothetical protein